MQRITLDNFRVYGTPAAFELAPVTVLTGKNNSGKSSLIKAFLVLADYLEQDDQTVLRLDGPRASRHRISDWQNLKNWDSADIDNLTLGYSQGEAQFLYEFENAGSRQPIHLYRFRMTIPQIGDMTLQSFDAGSGYQLEVTQKFIDYVTGGSAEKAKLLEAVTYPQKVEALRQQLAELNEKFNQAELDPDTAAAFPRLIQQRQQVEANIKNLLALSAQAENTAGIYFQALIQLAHLEVSPTIGALIQAALSEYVEYHEDEPDQSDDEETDVETDDLLEFEDEYYVRAEDPEVESNKSAEEIEEEVKRGVFDKAGELLQRIEFSKEQERRILFNFRQMVEHQMRFSIAHLGANRTYQARLYLTGTHHSEINTIAETFQRLGVFADGEAATFLEQWLPRFGIGEKAIISLVENVAIRIEVVKADKCINLADLGFGAGQILTVLLQIAALIQAYEAQGIQGKIASSVNPTLILIEEPEANLHPQLQSLLAELFVEIAQSKYGMRFVLETHSEYLIRKLQLLVAGQRVGTEKVALYYLGDGSQQRIIIQTDGKLSEEFGSGFFDEADERTMELFRLQKKAARNQPSTTTL